MWGLGEGLDVDMGWGNVVNIYGLGGGDRMEEGKEKFGSRCLVYLYIVLKIRILLRGGIQRIAFRR